MNRKERTVFVTIVINGLLILFKFWLAGLSGSLALRSSALHSLTDAAIGVFVLIGLFLSRRESGRVQTSRRIGTIENWVALVVSGAIFYVGADIVGDVLGGELPELRNLLPITLAALLTVVVAYVIARYKLYVGRETGSPALMASGSHSQVDIYASIVVVAGLAGAALGLPNLDTAAASVVAALIFLSGYQVAESAIRALRERRLLDLEGETGRRVHGHQMGWRGYGLAVIVLLISVYLLTGIYVVDAGESAVVRRFGKVIEQAGPGLHYRWPRPIERVDIVAVDQARRVETSSVPMLTGDENLVTLRASMHYSVNDPVAFTLNVADPERLVLQAGAAALRQIIAQEPVDALLTVDKTAIQERARATAQTALDGNGSGVRVIAVQILESAPPVEVADAFRDVASAREDQNTFINEAVAYENEVIPIARGDAERLRKEAATYATERIARAKGEATSFSVRQEAYASAPEITRQRLYLEAVESSLAGARKLLLDPAVAPRTTDLWLSQSGGDRLLPPAP